MPEATDRTARWVQSEDEARELAAIVVDPERTELVVCVTKQPALERPLLDPEALAERLGEKAQVWVITESADAWALTEALPPKIDVYGGAVRAWQPIPEGATAYPTDHPQWTVFGEGDAAKVTEQIVEYAALADNPPPPFGTEAQATVTAVRKAGAELDLDSGHPAFASTSHLIQHGDVFHAGEILVPGQEVKVRVGPWHAQAGRVSVSLRDFAPDAWERLGEVYEPGDLIDGVVSAIRDFGAFVELLPGVEGLLHKSKISDSFVEYVDDFVRPGDRLTLRLLSMDPGARKAEVSLLDAPAGEAPKPPAALFPGGPPWLPESADAFAEPEPENEWANGGEGEDRGDDDSADRAADGAEAPGTFTSAAASSAANARANAASAQAAAVAAAQPTDPFAQALVFMVEHHGEQHRKDLVNTPYVAHLMSVSALVMEAGGDQTDAIAALLHDTIEDAGGKEIEAVIAERFGPEVARIVRDVSDTDELPKPPWRERKEAYLAHLAQVDERSLRVSAADKLHNARSLLSDFLRDGDSLWERFHAGQEEQLWVYDAYGAAFEARLAELGASEGRTAELVAELRLTVEQLAAAVEAAA